MPTMTNAVIPKARGMYAKRLTTAEYEELMRRRTVPEVAAVLRRHPYFKDNLASLSPTDPHRGQIEELLDMDIFAKYEALAHFDPGKVGFSSYYLTQVEVRQIVRLLQLISIGAAGAYVKGIPPYLAGKTRLDLYAMGRAATLAEALAALQHTPYYRPVAQIYARDPAMQNFPLAESTMLRYYYTWVFELIDDCFSGADKTAVQGMFLQEAEVYNAELLFRVKAFFPGVFTAEEIQELMMPWRYRLGAGRMQAMLAAAGPDALMALYKSAGLLPQSAGQDIDALVMAGSRLQHAYARHLLHLTASPPAAIAAFLALVQLEKENIINIIEGVRYNLPPEKIRAMLLY